jgi:hypothetical protein
MAVYVYQFGLSAPFGENADLVYDQLFATHRYRNTLIEIERGRRAAVRAVIDASNAQTVALTAEVARWNAETEALAKRIKSQRASTRTRSESESDREALRQAREARKAAVTKLREARLAQRTDAAMTAAIDAINERANGLVRGARELTETYWGTYLLTEKAMQDSKALPLYGDDGISPNDPKFLRWEGDGALGVQIQGGAKAATILAEASTLLRMRPDARAYLERACDQRRIKDKTGLLTMRVGSDAKGGPIWATWHMHMHRLIPENAMIKGATVHLRKVGTKAEWSLEVTVEHSRAALPPNDKTIAIDIGWRMIGDELRVAGWMDSDGKTGELRLSAKDIRLLRRPEEIRGERDRHFTLAKTALGSFLASAAQVPDRLRAETAHLDRWGSADRLAAVVARWERFEGDAAIHNVMTAWFWRDRNLCDQEAGMRLQALRRRKNKYREWAAWVTETYGTVVVEKFDLRAVALRGAVEDPAANETARSNRQLAALSEARTAIVNAASSRGRLIAAMPAHDTTRACPSCGVVEAREAEASIVLVCPDCGATWDQDVTGAPVVLLGRWRERPGDAKILVSARDGANDNESETMRPNRWQKVKEARTAKVLRRESARAEASNGAE